jgi:Polyketide cyclase / dehydrase and lipid transport
VFAVHEVTVAVRLEVAAARLTHFANRGALRPASETAYLDGQVDGLRVGPFGGMRGLSKLVRVQFAEPVRRDDSVTMALRWEATGMTGELFPVLDADLTLTGDGGGQTRIRLDGSYRPPFGRTGAALDRAVLRRLAADTIQSLVESVADAVADPAPGRKPGEEPAARKWPVPEAGES